MAQTTIQSTTQNFIEIYDITNNLVLLNDGSAALILEVSAMNFGLLAEEEQDSVIYSYAGLLNSLNYPIQIIIQSNTKDVTNYLKLLKDQEQLASSQKKRELISRYRLFVSDLIRERNVLDKKFYITIPATALELGILPPSSILPGKQNQIDLSTVDRSKLVEKALTILEPKRDHLFAQLGRIGLYAKQLKTQEIIKVFYTSYNPEAAEGQGLTDTNSYTTPLVKASVTSPVQGENTNQPPERVLSSEQVQAEQNLNNNQQITDTNTESQTQVIPESEATEPLVSQEEPLVSQRPEASLEITQNSEGEINNPSLVSGNVLENQTENFASEDSQDSTLFGNAEDLPPPVEIN